MSGTVHVPSAATRLAHADHSAAPKAAKRTKAPRSSTQKTTVTNRPTRLNGDPVRPAKVSPKATTTRQLAVVADSRSSRITPRGPTPRAVSASPQRTQIAVAAKKVRAATRMSPKSSPAPSRATMSSPTPAPAGLHPGLMNGMGGSSSRGRVGV